MIRHINSVLGFILATLIGIFPLTAASATQEASNMDQQLVSQQERTLAIIKPDAVGNEVIGQIITRYEEAGFAIVGLKMIQITPQQAEKFYSEHQGKSFFPGLVSFMTSGPSVVLALQADNAVVKNRELIGATHPEKAASGTLRKDFGTGIPDNAVHGSDSPAAAEREILFFFQPNELFSR